MIAKIAVLSFPLMMSKLLRGIYVPYGLFCYEVTDNVLLKGTPDSAINSKTPEFPRHYFRKAFARIGHIPVDASYQLANESADRLETFFNKDLVEFDEGYLSGYYADLKDEDFTLLRSKAKARALEMFDGRLRSIPFVLDIKTVISNPKIKCVREDYALLPD